MIIELVGLALVVIFCFFFKSVTESYQSAFEHSKAKEIAEQQLAAAFIKNAIEIYELRRTRPDLLDPKAFKRSCDDLEDLVEQYYMLVEQKRKEQASGRIGLKLVKQ